MATNYQLSNNHVAILAQAIPKCKTIKAFTEKLAKWAQDDVATGDPWAVWLDIFPVTGHGDPEMLWFQSSIGRTPCDQWRAVIKRVREKDAYTVSSWRAEDMGFSLNDPEREITLVSVVSSREKKHVVIRMALPLSARKELGPFLCTSISQSLDHFSQKAHIDAADTTISGRYSKEAFENQLGEFSCGALETLILAPALFTQGLEALGLHMDSYLRETFGDAADDVFLERLRRSAREIGREKDPAQVEREFAVVKRALEVWASFLHIRGLMVARRQREGGEQPLWLKILPAALGAVLPADALPWRDLLGELLLVHWIGSHEAARLAFAHPWLHRRLAELGWWGGAEPGAEARELFAAELIRQFSVASVARFPHGDGKRAQGDKAEAEGPEDGAEGKRQEALRFWSETRTGMGVKTEDKKGLSLLSDLMKLPSKASAVRFLRWPAKDGAEAMRREALRFWSEPKAGMAVEGEGGERLFLLTRWMMLQQIVELQLAPVNRRALHDETSLLRRALDLLWERSQRFCLRWMLCHRQWSTPEGVDTEHGVEARRKARRWLEKGLLAGACHGGEASGEKDGSSGLLLHVDSLWTNLYLLHRIFRHMGPSDRDQPSWRALEEAFPTERALGTFLRHLCRVMVFVLWQIHQQERRPERYILVPYSERARHKRNQDTCKPGEVPDAGEAASGDDESASRNHPAGGNVGSERGAGQWNPWELPLFHQPVGAERYARSLVHLMDVFGHEVLHVERAVDIAGYMERVIRSELLLHAVSDYYRDHLFHLVDLCLLGDFLLTSRASRRRGHLFRLLLPPPEAGPDSGVRFHIDEVRRQWFVAAVFHDVGYLFSLLARLPKMLLEHDPPQHHRELVVSLDRVLRGEVQELERKITDLTGHLTSPQVGLDRGVQSAVILQDHLLQGARNGRHENTELVSRYLPSLRAICQHSLMTEPIRQDRDPLSYLMVLCDELQDWGRNRVRARELRRYTVFRTADDANWQERRIPILTELYFPVEGLEGDDFVLTVDRTAATPEGQPSPSAQPTTLRIVQVYGQDEVGYLNPVYLWILRAQNLQRLIPSVRRGRRLQVEVVTVTGVPERLRRVGSTYSGVFQDLAVRFPRLRLGDLLNYLQRMFCMTMSQAELGRRGGSKHGSRFDLWFAQRIEMEMRCRHRMVELQIFRLEDLSRAVPLPGFSREEDMEEVAQRYQQLLHELQDQRRLRGLHPLRSGRIGGIAENKGGRPSAGG